MKKILLLISCLIISVATAFAAGLNAYAFGAGYRHDTNTNKLHISWSQQAQAARVTIVALDGGNRYVLAEYRNLGAARHEYVIDLWDAVAAGMPTNTDLEVAIEVRTADRTQHEFVKKIDFQWPFSIDIDRNPYSKYFGLMYVGQMNNSKDRGIYVLDQQGGVAKEAQIDKDITLYTYWYDRTHAVPYMVRTFQDGTGRLLISSSDRDQDTHLWLAKPQTDAAVPVYSEWTNVITSTQLKQWTGHNVSVDKFANAGLDIRDNGDYWDILLYMATVNSSTPEHEAGNAYSGMYRVAKSSTNTNLTGGTYTPYTAKSHSVISNAYTASMFNAGASFDKFGGVLYNATSEGDNPNNSAFIHKTLNGQFKSNYADGDYLKRGKARTKGARFSPDFSKLAIAQGRMADELRIYNVSQADGNSHVTLSNGQSVNIITGTSGVTYADRVFVHDIAWDYAMNVYASVRNQGSKYGIYAVATDLNGAPVTTPVQGIFNVDCPDGEFTISLSSDINAGATLTGAGTYASCTPVTVTATPDGSHKFLRWSEGGVEVSKEPSYTFYATKNRNLVAEFAYAVYNVEWYNLFEEGKDITTIGVDNHDNNVNNRLWYLFMPMFNEYCGTSISNPGTVTQTGDVKNAFHVLKFLDGQQTNTTKFMTNENSPFYWLGMYIKAALGANETIANNTYEWPYLLHLFFNRTNQCYNINGDNVSNLSDIKKYFYNNTIPDFTTKGHPDYWRKYWTRYACNLPMELSYDQSLPTDWNKIAKPSTYVTYEPTWYKWNNVWSPQNNGNNHTHILAWRAGSATGEIVNHVPTPEPGQESVKLYATYIKKHIHENDPDLDPNDKCDAKNSDVLKLLFNDHWDGAWHKITITRKLQAGMYNTICLPFNVNLNTDLPADGSLDEAEFWQYDGTVSSTYNQSGEPVSVLNFTRVTDRLVAGTPYLVEVKKDVTNDLFFSGALDYDGKSVLCDTTLRPVIADPEAEVKINFVGTINPTTIPEGSLILVANNRLALTTAPGRMEGMRGYFTIDPMWAAEIAEQAADGRVYLSMKKPVTTSIPVAPEAEQQVKPEVRKVMYDGKIYILRGEEVYTITGHRVR